MSAPTLTGPFTAVYTKLQNDATLTTLVAARVWMVEAKHDEDLPHVIFTPVSAEAERYWEDGADVEDLSMDFQVDVYESAEDGTAASAMTIQDRIITLLECANITVTGYVNAHTKSVQLGNVTKEEDAYRVTSTWRLSATPT